MFSTCSGYLSDGFWLTLRAARIADIEPHPIAPDPSTPSIVVTIEETSATERLELFGRAFALTPREYELVGLLARDESPDPPVR